MTSQPTPLPLSNHLKGPCPAVNIPMTSFNIERTIKSLYQDINTNIWLLTIIPICLCLPTYSYIYSNVPIRLNYFYVLKYDRDTPCHTMSMINLFSPTKMYFFLCRCWIPPQSSTTSLELSAIVKPSLIPRHSKFGHSLQFYNILIMPALL